MFSKQMLIALCASLAVLASPVVMADDDDRHHHATQPASAMLGSKEARTTE